MTPEELARLFYDEHQRLAADFGWHPLDSSWDDAPSDHKGLILAVAANVLKVMERCPEHEEPRFTVRESTGYVTDDASTERTEIMVLDRADCHKVVWSSFRDSSMATVPLHKQRAHAYLRAALMEREYA